MIYFIGDLHRDWYKVKFICNHYNTTKNDILIILGDSELNYFLDKKDEMYKKKLNSFPITLLIIHGNHDCRPENINSYKTKIWNGGIVYYEEKFSSLLFAKDGEIYSIYNKKFIVCGGAYSIDKDIRISKNIPWWEDEQPNEKIKREFERKLSLNNWNIDYVITHTCPLKYEPIESFSVYNNDIEIDKTIECWFDDIEKKLNYKHWYCGHFHIDKHIENISFVYDNPTKLKL